MTVLVPIMNRHFSFTLLFYLLFFFLSVPFVQAQEQHEDCDDCPEVVTEEIEIATGDTTKVASDSLYLLRDTEGAIYAKKFEEKFKQKYKGKEDFTYEETEQKVGLLQQIKQAIAEWFRRNFSSKVGEELDNYYYVVILRILGFILIGFILFYLIRAFIQKDIYWLFKKQGKKINAFEDLTSEDFKSTNFDALIAEALQNKHYRLAIRMYYLWLLQRLQEQEKITWAPEKTNADYSYELKDSQDKKQFVYLSYLYNNIWYGEYEITEEEFSKAKKSFDSKLNPTNL